MPNSTVITTGTDITESAEISHSTDVMDSAAPDIEGDLLEDSLVEEVSIDGMCGVY